MQCLLQLRHLLSEGRYLSNNKPQHGLWISVSSCEFHSITNAEIFFGKHAFVCVLLLISAVQQLEKRAVRVNMVLLVSMLGLYRMSC